MGVIIMMAALRLHEHTDDEEQQVQQQQDQHPTLGDGLEKVSSSRAGRPEVTTT